MMLSNYVGVGVSPGNVGAVVNYSKVKAIDKRVRIAELFLRCLILCLAILSALLLATDSQVKEIFTIRKQAKFTDMKALVLIVITNGLAAAYSAGHVVRCVLSMVRGKNVLLNKPLAWAIFSGDQVMAYLSVAAAAAGGQSAALAKLGQAELQWMKICDMYGKFCNQIGQGLAAAVVMSLSAVLLSAISAFTLFRLHGLKKTNNLKGSSGAW